ncbi:S-layer homology domain-containing protein [Peribacillus sp. NPDC096379]|uniref:S-layer homology domain-containing protein n=1 Tax=Peribacillus sp. NPDC096379 TaxID=3364393 RepID=UPI0038245624
MFKSFKQYIATAATIVLLATAAVPAYAESDYEPSYSFTDVGSRYAEAVDFLYATGIINGISKTKFGTDQNLTRGDAAVILADTLGLDTKNAKNAGFKDTFPRIAGSVNALVEAGIVSGVTADRYEPKEPLTRGAMAKFLNLSFELSDYATETPFSDVGGVFKEHIEALYGSGIASGKTATSYGTKQNISRGDFANLLYNSIMFSIDDEFSSIVSADLIDSKTMRIHFAEAVPEDYTAEDMTEYMLIIAELEDGQYITSAAKNGVLSSDRMSLTFTHTDLAGKAGTLYIDDLELPFNYKTTQEVTETN